MQPNLPVKEDFIDPSRLCYGLTKAVILIAGLVIFGWAVEANFIHDYIPGLIYMNPTTAVLFILSAGSLYLIADVESEPSISVGKQMGLLVAVIASIRLLGLNPQWDIGIDQFLFGARLNGNRIAADTTANFFLIGLAIYLTDRKRNDIVISQILSLTAFLLSLWACIGYLYSTKPLYHFQNLQPMALTSAISFLLLTLAVFLSRPRTGLVSVLVSKRMGGVIFRKLIPFGIGVPVITGLLRLEGQRMNIFDQELGSAIAIIFIISIFAFLMWSLAKSLNKTDHDRVEAEQNLRKVTEELSGNESKYRSLIENAGVVMFTSSMDGYFTFASTRSQQLTGYSRHELLNMHFTDLIEDSHKQLVTEKYLNQVINLVPETQIEFCIITKAGEKKWVEQSAVMILDNGVPVGFQCAVKDISERKSMEDVVKKYEMEIVQSQKRLQSVLDNATSLIYIKDLEGKYLLVNKQFKEIFNVEEKDVTGKTAYDFMDRELAERITAGSEQVRTTGIHMEIQETITLEDGDHHFLITKFPLLDTQNQIFGLAGIGTDITERVQHEGELKESKRIAEDAKKLQEQFLANMSHEIRTPMNGIQGMTDLLLETELTYDQKDFVSSIKRSSDNLLVIINDILDFSKIQAGKLTIENIDFTLNEVLDNISAIFRQRLREKDLYLVMNLGSEIPQSLKGDPYRLNQILVNIIGNAIKFTNRGGISVRVEMENKTDNSLTLNFTVSDTGIGIPQEKLGVIFESFTQANIDTSRKYGGTGLGLAITRQLLELQGGTISLDSEVDNGTTFRFSIPYTYTTNTNKLFLPGTDIKSYQSLFVNRKFLVAEDNEVNQKVIMHVIKKAGGRVTIANDGLEAIEMLKNDSSYDLIIMDLQMPKMDGHSATIHIRNEMKLDTPIIAMTASALKGEKLKCLSIGMNAYLSKPFEINYLYKTISQLLGEIPLKPLTMETQRSINDALFDLSLLSEMDDNEYTAEILTLFLTTTPEEIFELKKACANTDYDYIYKVAHKIKGSAGLLQAERFVQVLLKLEELGRNKINEGLLVLAERASAEFKMLETPLREELQKVQQALRQTV